MLSKLSSLLGLSLLLCFSFTTSLLAKPRSAPTSQDASGEPVHRTVGGGTRNEDSFPPEDNNQEGEACSSSSQSSTPTQALVTPLVPQNNIILTQQERVNLYIYVPPTITNKTAMLEIVDLSSQEIVFIEFLEFESTEVIARLVLPNTIALATTQPSEQRYQWRLSSYCSQQTTAQLLAEGWINRLDLNSDSNSVLWHENLELWFAQRDEDPDVWLEGLATEALEHYANYPVQTYVFTSPDSLHEAGEF
ncbi:MAG: DUF928 domain-containing protein [Spirulina sp. SIO3F2]|nr:DUF928 domain-containing protein [Spirulina sp. SIO3F2]